MAENYQMPRGTQDLYGETVTLWQQAERIIREQCALYGYQEIRTPIFEHTEVFKTANDSSDMVTKEMYSFQDNGGRSLTLRPEGTKAVVRAFVEHKMYGAAADFPQKLFYIGPMFRYERPQKGRYRQFHQFGVEAIGVRSPQLDVETIALGCDIAEKLGVARYTVLVNTLGNEASRARYRQALKDHFEPYLSELCEDCRHRWQVNPLRILDCKVDKDHPSFASAPRIRDYLDEPSAEYFRQVIQGLDDLGIPYRIDDHLVRGLDYYSNTVYEAVPVDDGGQQAAVFAGGQYDGLVESFGGGALPGVGFGMGLERMIELAQRQGGLAGQPHTAEVYVITMGDVGDYALRLAQQLRRQGISTEINYQDRGLKGQFKAADRLQARVVAIIGEDERNNGTVTLKDNLGRQQKTVKWEDAAAEIRSLTGQREAKDGENQ